MTSAPKVIASVSVSLITGIGLSVHDLFVRGINPYLGALLIGVIALVVLLNLLLIHRLRQSLGKKIALGVFVGCLVAGGVYQKFKAVPTPQGIPRRFIDKP